MGVIEWPVTGDVELWAGLSEDEYEMIVVTLTDIISLPDLVEGF